MMAGFIQLAHVKEFLQTLVTFWLKSLDTIQALVFALTKEQFSLLF
jgi:hypothetical protein